MVDSEFVAVGAETQARLTDLGVMPKPRGEGEQAKPDYRRQGPMLIEQGDSVVASIRITARGKASGVKTDVRFYPHAKIRDHRDRLYLRPHGQSGSPQSRGAGGVDQRSRILRGSASRLLLLGRVSQPPGPGLTHAAPSQCRG